MNNLFNTIKQKINPSNSNWIVILIYFFLAILAIRGVLFNGETIGLRHDWAVPEDSTGVINWVKEALYPWSEERGGMSISYWSDIVLRFTVGLFGFIGLGGSFLSKFFILFSIVMAGLGSYILFKKITNTGHLPSFIGSVIYVFNPLMFNKIISGHTYYLIAYALSPLFFYYFLKSFPPGINKTNFWLNIILCGLLYALCGSQTQFVILLLIFTVILVYIQKLSIKKYIFNLIIIGLIALLLHLSWLTVFFLSSIYYQNPVSVTPSTFSWFVYNSSHIYQSFFLVGGATDYLTRSLQEYYLFAPWLATACFLFLLILFYLGKSNKKSSYFKYFFFFLLFVLALSISRIVPELTFAIFKKSILFNIFREVYHATFLAAITFAILLVYSLDYLIQQKNKYLKILIGLSVVIFISPFFIDGKLINNIQSFSLDNQYLPEISDTNRVLYLPAVQPLLAEGLEHSGVDPNIYFSNPPSLSQITSFGSLTDRFNTFFQSQLYFNSDRISPVLEKYFQLLNVDNIVYRPNIKSDLVKFTLLSDYPDKIALFQNSSLAKILTEYSEYISSETKNWILYQFNESSKIINSRTCLSSGGWYNLNQIFTLSGQAECDGVFFAKDTKYSDIETSNVIYNNNNDLDFLVKNENNIILEPGICADQTMNPKENWVSASHVWWYHPQFAGYSKMLAFTSAADVKLSLDVSNIPQNSYQVFVETFNHPAGDNIKIDYHDWEQTIDNNSITTGFKWNELGLLTFQPDDEKLVITNLGGENAVGLILLIPESDYNNQIEDFNEYLTSKNKIILINPEEVSQPISINFDLADDVKFYPNFPEFSEYEMTQEADKLTIDAKFTGPADQDEYATIIYSARQYNLKQTPTLSIYAKVDNEDVQFWEMGLELDHNNDDRTDSYVWGRLINGQNLINIKEFIINNNSKANPDKIDVIAIRFQPHKEYSVNMNDLAKQEYSFEISDMSLYSVPNQVIRPARTKSQISIDKLLTEVPHTIMFTGMTNLYNDFDNTAHQMEVQDHSIKITSNFTNEKESSEYATVIINTIVDLDFYPYFTADLGITNPDIQFFDLSFGIDTNNDDEVDYHIWVDSIYFDQDSNNQTVFYDLKNLLQLEVDNYQTPRLIQIEILPHKQYLLESDIKPVEFNINNFNFYHEAAIQSAQTDALPASSYQINIPEEGDYYLYLNVDSVQEGELFGSLSQNNFQIDVKKDSQKNWYKIDQFNLSKGENNLALITYDQNFVINTIALFDMEQSIAAVVQPTSINKINPVHFQANIELDQPGYVLFKESYHPAWFLAAENIETGEKIEIRPILINGWQQAYYLDTPGKYKLDFKYSLTNIYHICLVISLISVILFTSSLIILSIYTNKTNHEKK